MAWPPALGRLHTTSELAVRPPAPLRARPGKRRILCSRASGPPDTSCAARRLALFRRLASQAGEEVFRRVVRTRTHAPAPRSDDETWIHIPSPACSRAADREYVPRGDLNENDVSHPLLIGRICISSRSDTYEPTRRASVGGMGYGSTSALVSQTWLVLSARMKQTLGRHQSDLRVASTCAADLSCRASSSQSDRLLLSVLDLRSDALCKQPRQSACTSFA